MPAPIVIVHDEPCYAEKLAAPLNRAGFETALFPDALAAMAALDAPRRIRLLITRVAFAPGRSNGVALARMLRGRVASVKFLFICRPEYVTEARELGTVVFYGAPPDVVARHALPLLRSDD